MAKQNLNKMVMVGLQNAGEEGIVPIKIARGDGLQQFNEAYKIVSLMESWASRGKVTRLYWGGVPIYNRYVLTKHVNMRT